MRVFTIFLRLFTRKQYLLRDVMLRRRKFRHYVHIGRIQFHTCIIFYMINIYKLRNCTNFVMAFECFSILRSIMIESF